MCLCMQTECAQHAGSLRRQTITDPFLLTGINYIPSMDEQSRPS